MLRSFLLVAICAFLLVNGDDNSHMVNKILSAQQQFAFNRRDLKFCFDRQSDFLSYHYKIFCIQALLQYTELELTIHILFYCSMNHRRLWHCGWIPSDLITILRLASYISVENQIYRWIKKQTDKKWRERLTNEETDRCMNEQTDGLRDMQINRGTGR